MIVMIVVLSLTHMFVKDFVQDRPNCLVNGRWQKSRTAVLDIIDRINQVDNPTVQDRHDCGVIDANNDGLPDIYCMVGTFTGIVRLRLRPRQTSILTAIQLLQVQIRVKDWALTNSI